MSVADPLPRDVLPVVMAYSNPAGFHRRPVLAREYMARMQAQSDVALFVVELAYGSRPFEVTEAADPSHRQLRTDGAALWQKENLINIGVRSLLPPSWSEFAWIDCDLEFDNPRWAQEALAKLRGESDVVQLLDHVVDLDEQGSKMGEFDGIIHTLRRHGRLDGIAGFAWAMTRRTYEKVGGLFEISILGGGDNIMAHCFAGRARDVKDAIKISRGFRNAMLAFQAAGHGARLDYVPGTVRHHFHGARANRGYGKRGAMMKREKYDPDVDLVRRPDGLLSLRSPDSRLARVIAAYFANRKEDE